MADIRLHNIDCMDFMKGVPDKAYDLAIADPPYGIGEDGGKCRTRGSKHTNGEKAGWDNERPTIEYFNELRRVSMHQIIFGGNYFADLLPASRCWLYWQKELGGDFADGELIWTSFDMVVRQYKKRSESFNRIHPTQKPVSVYRWLLNNYAQAGDKIIDTHGGSGSILLACYDLNFEIDWMELDLGYFRDAEKRFDEHISRYAPASQIPVTKKGELKLF